MIKKILKYFLILILVILISVGALYSYIQNHLDTSVKTSKVLFIPKGSTKSVIHYLTREGIEMQFFDYYLLKYYGYPQAGWIDLGAQSMTRSEFYYKITHSKAAVREITLIPGETKEIFFAQISGKLDLNQTKLLNHYQKIAPFSDGVILADTYSVPIGIDEVSLIEHLLESSLKSHRLYAKEALVSFDTEKWFKKYITMASIITKEAAGKDEFPLVSAVIYNRLKINMPLQMDGTLNYKYQSHKKVTAKMIREDDSIYNTYKHHGLPPHPICAVTKEAIMAAIHPSDVNYLYFVREKNGKHYFSNSYKKHLQAIKRSNSVK
ncbi:MAG: endolytic transglycosylase MltG [Epsilonproteobacteria bacterium]|nr:endolytic transglycosylase MltG [Campylobacterota bacterium]